MVTARPWQITPQRSSAIARPSSARSAIRPSAPGCGTSSAPCGKRSSTRDVTAAEDHLRRATRALDKAVTKGLIHRNNAARRVSRLARAVSNLKTGAAAS